MSNASRGTAKAITLVALSFLVATLFVPGSPIDRCQGS